MEATGYQAKSKSKINAGAWSVQVAILGSVAIHLVILIGIGWCPVFVGSFGGSNPSEVLEITVHAKSENAGVRSRQVISKPVPSNKVDQEKLDLKSQEQSENSGDTNHSEELSQNLKSGVSSNGALGLRISRWPKVKKEVKAIYPENARKMGIEGTVTLKVLVDEKGLPAKIEVIDGPGYGLNQAAVSALKGYLFTPAYAAGHSVAVSIVYKYKFEIN